jgi:nitrous oxidase accessory protein NosD
MKRKNGIFLGGILVFVVLASSINSMAYEEQKQKTNNIFTDLTSSTPINIIQDSNFTDYGFSGSGISGDPYLIANLNITGSYIYGIHINGNVTHPITVYFEIRNCYIEIDDTGIDISNTLAGRVIIDNCVCCYTNSGAATGIHVEASEDIIIKNCHSYQNLHTGIRADACTGAYLYNNTCSWNMDEGIYIDSATDFATLESNVCYLNGLYGIYSEACQSVTFVHNNLTRNLQDAMALIYSNLAIVENNSIVNNDGYAIYCSYSDNLLIKFNNITDNDLYGVILDAYCDNGVIHHNNFVDNNIGLTQASEDYTSGHGNATWYDAAKSEGNYWDDLVVAGPYDIAGACANQDLYPLNGLVDIIIIPELQSNLYLCIILLFSMIGLVSIKHKKK